MNDCRHGGPNERWSITQSWGTTLERLGRLAEADLGYIVTKSFNCEWIGWYYFWDTVLHASSVDGGRIVTDD